MTGLSKHWMTSTSRGSSTIEPNLWLKALLDLNGFYAAGQVFRGFDGVSSVSGSKVMAKRPEIY